MHDDRKRGEAPTWVIALVLLVILSPGLMFMLGLAWRWFRISAGW